MKKLALWIILVLLVGLMLGALMMHRVMPHSEPVPSGKTGERYFKMNLGTEPPTLDPAAVNDLVSMTVLNNIMRGLTQYGPHQEILPAYAERWERSADARHYRFHLRHTGQWSDGKPVVAQDFVYAWRRVLDAKNASPYAFLLYDIHNAEPYYKGKIKDPRQLGFRALDDYTLSVDLDRPVAFFLDIMAFSISLPLRQDMVQRYGDRFTEAGHFVTNGPYKLATWAHENEIILKPNPKYWAGPPQNAGIQMVMIPEPNTSLIMYENNELDFAETSTSLPVKEVRRLKYRSDYHHNTLNGISYIGFNTEKPPFNNPLVRKAFIYAFDRRFIPKLFQGGEKPIKSWISPGLTAYNPNIGLGFDPVKANRLLAKAGYAGGKSFPKVEFWYANTTPENRELAEIAQFQWEHNLGVHVEIKNVEWKMYLKQLDEDPPQIFRLQWFVDYPDPDSFLGVFISDSGNGHIRWKDSRYDRWVKAAAIESNPQKRFALYNQAQRLLLEETAGIMPLYVVPKSYLLKQDVAGFTLNELNIALLDHVHFVPNTLTSPD